MTAYYNENDPRLTPWLYELMAAGVIAPGVVDTRSILDVRPGDLAPYAQCHFFAGIGVWSYALRLAGWPDDRRVWTGSCPCQPFSAAGKGAGFDDERHLWPAWFQLIAQRRPDRVYGEQVASKDGLAWLDLVHADLEAAGYSCGPVDLCAAGVGAPHIRQRLWFVADANGGHSGTERKQRSREQRLVTQNGVACVGLADDDDAGLRQQRGSGVLDSERTAQWDDVDGRGAVGDMGDASSRGLGEFGGSLVAGQIRHADRSVVVSGLANSPGERSDGRGPVLKDRRTTTEPQGLRAPGRAVDNAHVAPAIDSLQAGWAVHGGAGSAGRTVDDDDDDDDDEGLEGHGGVETPSRGQGGSSRRTSGPVGPASSASFWSDCDWIPCRDGKTRPVEPGTFPLVNGAPARVVRLRAYGNAIVAEAAAEVIRATLP